MIFIVAAGLFVIGVLTISSDGCVDAARTHPRRRAINRSMAVAFIVSGIILAIGGVVH